MKLTKLFVLFPFFLQAQVGIGTTSPTQTLDVNGNTRVRGLSNTAGRTVPVSALPDGTLVTTYSNNTAPGARFVGFLPADLPLDTQQTFKDIILSNELVDVLNEYDATTGRYTPSLTGFYKVSMDFDIGDYDNVTDDLDILVGLWDYTLNQWVLRRTFKHRGNNNPTISGSVARNESYGISNYLQLDSTHSYGFRINPGYNTNNTTRTARLKAQNYGATGSSLSTSFSIEKML